MKVIINYKDNDSINYVRALDYYKTEEERQKVLDRINELTISGDCKFKIIEVDNDIEDVINFLLGENKYKMYSDIDDLDDSVSELGAELRNVYDTIFDMNETLEGIEKKFQKIKDKIENENL